MNALTERQRGTCPFTGKPYDCHVCESHKTVERINTGRIHMVMSVDGPLSRNKFGEWKKLAKFFSDCGHHTTWIGIRDEYKFLNHLGVEVLPMCDCKMFCFKKGCMKPEEPKDGQRA